MQVAIHMYGNYFEGETVKRSEVEVRVGKFRNVKMQVSMRLLENGIEMLGWMNW